jgi:CDP-glycerol glycerophosphotransferase
VRRARPDDPRVPRISVVIPIYNVEAYLAECLESLGEQGVADYEAILVDDGSTDDSGAIARRYAARDPRLRLVHQENAGLGNARNTGVAIARGEYVAFLDSDDKLPPGAYARLLASAERTGSDLVTGNVHRFDSRSTWPAAFLARAFILPRRRTHVRRFRWLLSDRMAQNKLWRRSFWAEHGFRFPEGVVHEDIPVVVPAHFLARSVDVVKEPVYLYREREDGVPSITQRRAELVSLRDRLAACEHVSAFLAARSPGVRRWYDESIAEDDLRYHIDVLEEADEEYRALFLDRACAFLDRAGPGVEARLPAIQRLKWHLVRRRMMPELLEVVRFQREGGASRKVRVGGRAYGDYPFLGDPALGIPRAVYRLDTTRRRARHVAALTRPYVVPHRRPGRPPRALEPATPVPVQPAAQP